MTKQKQVYGTTKKVSQQPHPTRVVDMEVDCVLCKTRLYVSDAAIEAVEECGRLGTSAAAL